MDHSNMMHIYPIMNFDASNDQGKPKKGQKNLKIHTSNSSDQLKTHFLDVFHTVWLIGVLLQKVVQTKAKLRKKHANVLLIIKPLYHVDTLTKGIVNTTGNPGG